MIATANMVLLATVLASAGLIAAYEGVAPRKDDAPATFSERFPRQDEMFKSVVRVGAGEQGPHEMVNRARKADKIVPEKIVALGEFCANQQWPYIDPACLQRTAGSAVRRPNRTITAERRITGDETALVLARLETLALR